MATPELITAEKTSSLANLNTLVAQKEQILGPLIAIGNDGNRTILTFDSDQDPPHRRRPPQKNAVLTTAAAGGSGSRVASGQIFIEGTLTETIATRSA